MEQLEEPNQKRTMGNDDAALIREIYELTHQVSINNNPELRLRLTELTAQAEKRKLL